MISRPTQHKQDTCPEVLSLSEVFSITGLHCIDHSLVQAWSINVAFSNRKWSSMLLELAQQRWAEQLSTRRQMFWYRSKTASTWQKVHRSFMYLDWTCKSLKPKLHSASIVETCFFLSRVVKASSIHPRVWQAKPGVELLRHKNSLAPPCAADGRLHHHASYGKCSTKSLGAFPVLAFVWLRLGWSHFCVVS